LRQSLWTATSIALVAWLVLWHAEAICLAMGQEPELAAAAGEYMRFAQWALLPHLGYVALRSFVTVLQRPRAAMSIVLMAVVLNVPVAWFLIFGAFGIPGFGLAGAGIATTISMSLMFAGMAVALYTDRRFRRYHLFGRFWRADWPRFREIWRLGLPIGATMTFEVTVFSAATFLMGLVGADALAAHAIALQIALVAFMIPLGLGQAASVRVGRAFGRGDPE